MESFPSADFTRGIDRLMIVRECSRAYLSALEHEEKVDLAAGERPECWETRKLTRSATLACLRALALESKAAEEDPNTKKVRDL
jgi:hypothetical protein